MGGGDEAADDGDAGEFRCGDALDGGAIAIEEPGALDEVAGRVAADGEFGEEDQVWRRRRAPARANRMIFVSITGKISDCGVDLAESNLHSFSLEGWMEEVETGVREFALDVHDFDFSPLPGARRRDATLVFFLP